jgi:hypothetical protein
LGEIEKVVVVRIDQLVERVSGNRTRTSRRLGKSRLLVQLFQAPAHQVNDRRAGEFPTYNVPKCLFNIFLNKLVPRVRLVTELDFKVRKTATVCVLHDNETLVAA